MTTRVVLSGVGEHLVLVGEGRFFIIIVVDGPDGSDWGSPLFPVVLSSPPHVGGGGDVGHELGD
jgi:hypothetical protein